MDCFGLLKVGFVRVIIGVQRGIVDFHLAGDLITKHVGQHLVARYHHHLLDARRLIQLALAGLLRQSHDLAHLIGNLAFCCRRSSGPAVLSQGG